MHFARFNIDWHSAFVPTISIAEIILRGTLMYLGISAILRFVLKREAATVGMGDLLMMVLLANAAQNTITSKYSIQVTGGLKNITVKITIMFYYDAKLFFNPPFPNSLF